MFCYNYRGIIMLNNDNKNQKGVYREKNIPIFVL